MKRNLLLLVICALIIGFYFWDQDRQEKQEAIEKKERDLVALEKDEIKTITLQKYQTVFQAQKEDDTWMMVEPIKTKGDQDTWGTILDTFARAEHERVINENVEDFSPYGLDDTTFQVTLAGEDGQGETTIIFGNKTPVAGSFYATIKGTSDVITVRESMMSNSDKGLYELRDKTILEVDPETVKRAHIQNVAGNIDTVIDHNSDDEWIITEPITARANATVMQDIINNIKNGEISRFIEETPDIPEIYGLPDPRMKLTFWTGEGDDSSNWASRAIVLGSTSEETEHIYARRDGQQNVFTIKPEVIKDIPTSLDEFRMKKLTTIRSWEANMIQAVSAGTVIAEVSKEENNWIITNPDQGKAEYNSVSTAVRSIVELEAKAFVTSLQDAGYSDENAFDSPDVEFTVQSEEKSITIPLVGPWVTPEDEIIYFAKKSDPDEILVLDGIAVAQVMDNINLMALDEPETPDTPETEPEE